MSKFQLFVMSWRGDVAFHFPYSSVESSADFHFTEFPFLSKIQFLQNFAQISILSNFHFIANVLYFIYDFIGNTVPQSVEGSPLRGGGVLCFRFHFKNVGGEQNFA